jgi:alpha-glucosidase
MIKIQATDESVSLFWNGLPLLEHSHQDPAISVGEGEGHYKERHGSYKIRNLWQRKEKKLRHFDVVEQNPARAIIVFENTLTLVAEAIDNRLELRFTANDTKLNRLFLKLKAQTEERIYGCGEQFTHLNLKGRKVPLWCEEQGIGRGFDLISLLAEVFYGAAGRWYTTYFPQPTFVSSAHYFLHAHSSSYAEFDFRKNNFHTLHFWEIPQRITFASAKTQVDVVAGLSQLLGRQPRLPEWAYSGAWLGIQGGIAIVKERVQKMVAAGTPVAAVWAQDWEGVRVTPFGRQLWWNWEYDAERYPKLSEECTALAMQGIRFLGYINPFLALEKNLHKVAQQKNLLIKKDDGTEAYALVTSFPAAMLDFTNPSTRVWIKDIIKANMIDTGLSGWMADFGEWAPPRGIRLHSGEDTEKHHNNYPVQWAQLNREAIEEAGRGSDLVFFTRAGYTGTSRYSPIIWAGDQLVNWSLNDGLASVIPAAISLGYSGIGVTHADIGGYTTAAWIKRSKELFLRWAEMGAFTPIFRTHEGNRPQDNWQFHSCPETISHFARMAKIHAALAPYVKQTLNEYYEKGIPAQRHIALHYENDTAAHQQKYSYLYGRDLLVAPVYLKGKKKWKVYLPQDTWIHAWSKQELKQGWHTVNAPLGEPPVFWRKESTWAKLFLEAIC